MLGVIGTIAGGTTSTATNDFDENGLALIDEFSDVISQCVSEPFDGDIVVRSIRRSDCGKEL